MKLSVENNEMVVGQKLDLAYLLMIFSVNSDDPWPGWTGFNTMLRQFEIATVLRDGYLPLVDVSPTEYSTLNEVSKSCAESLINCNYSRLFWYFMRRCMRRYNT